MQKLLTEREVASQISMSVHWLRRKRLTGGGIPFLKMSDTENGAIRYEQVAVTEFINSRSRRSTCDQGAVQAA